MASRNILLLGADGQVGWELQRSLAPLGEVTAYGRHECDLEESVEERIAKLRPDILVNAAAYTAVDQAEAEPARAMRVNADAVGEMARAARELGALFVHYSTDYVFDGAGTAAFDEDDATGPLNVYGRSKLAGEEAIRAVSGCRHLIFRTSWVYALRGRNFARTILERARVRDSLPVVSDTFGVPTSAELIADVTALALHRLAQRADAQEDLLGTYHLVPSGETSWHGYARYLVAAARTAGAALRVREEDIAPVPASAFPTAARRPMNSRMDNRRISARFGIHLPDWRVHVRRFADEFAREGVGTP